MSLLPFLLVTAIGSAALLLARRAGSVVALNGPLVLLLALVSALLITPGQAVVLGEAGFATTAYLRLFLALGALIGMGLVIVGSASDDHRDAAAVTLAILGSAALALALPDARLAVLAATLGGVVGVVLPVAARGGRAGATAGVRLLRATVVAGTMAVAATAWIGRDLSDLAAQPVVFGLAYLAFATAVAIRFGAIPFHAWAGRLTDAIPDATLPLITGWSAAAFAIVALAWTDASIAPLEVDTSAVRLVVLAIAVASIVLGSVAALIQDDIEHVVGYSIVGDAGVVILALVARDVPEAWAPARMWILAFVATRSAFAAWAAATRASFGTGRIDALRGWLTRSPILALALALVMLASIGLPGLAAYDARSDLVDLALDSPWSLLLLLATLSPLAYYGRLLVIGASRPTGPIEPIAWGPRMEPVDRADLRAWAEGTWRKNRVFTVHATTTVLALLALAVAAGAFGGPEAAAGLPPSIQVVVESFEPTEPEPPLDDRSFAPDGSFDGASFAPASVGPEGTTPFESGPVASGPAETEPAGSAPEASPEAEPTQ